MRYPSEKVSSIFLTQKKYSTQYVCSEQFEKLGNNVLNSTTSFAYLIHSLMNESLKSLSNHLT